MTPATPKKIGRAKLSPSEKRSAPLYIRLTRGEHRRFLAVAKAMEEPPTFVARRVLLRWLREQEETMVRSAHGKR